MTAHITFNDNGMKEFVARNAVFADALLALMAAGIEIKMKTGGEIPMLTKSTKWAQRGALRASIRHAKIALGHYVVSAGEGTPAAAYAAAQEAGMTRGHTMKNYSTSGTGPHFFQHAIDNVRGRETEYVTAAKNAAGLGE